MVSAPYAAKLMADMGAEVIKVERPGAGDPARSRGPFPGGQSHPEKSGLFLYLNANKHGVTLDIAQAGGLRAARSAGRASRRADPQYFAARDGPDRVQLPAPGPPQPAPGDDVDRAVWPDRGASRLARRGADGLVVGRGLRAQRRRRQPSRTAAAQDLRQPGRLSGRRAWGGRHDGRGVWRGCAAPAASTSRYRGRSRSFHKTKWSSSTGPTWE